MSGLVSRTLIASAFVAFVALPAQFLCAPPKVPLAKSAQLDANCQSIPLLEMHEDDPQTEPCMRANAWNLFVKDLVDGANEPTWGRWCFVINGTPRSLLCTDQSKNYLQPLSISTKVSAANLTMHFGLLLSMGDPRQLVGSLALSPPASNSSKQLSQPLRAGSNGLSPSAPVFTAAMVVFSQASAQSISDCFSGKKDRKLPGFERITLGGLSARCTEQSFSDSLTKVQSIALKTVWAVVTDDGEPQHAGPRLSTTVPIWVEPDPHDPNTTQLQPGSAPLDPAGSFWSAPSLDLWSTYVRLALDDSACPANQDYRPSSVGDTIIPLNCFYNFPVSLQEYNRFLQWANIRNQIASPHTAGNMYFVLLGIHVTKKEIPNWTWQTFWWNWRKNSDDKSPYQRSASQPGGINDGRWSHYAARVTYGAPSTKPTSYSPKPVFNPYLETPLPNGIKSNCFTCHQYALLRKNDHDPARRFTLSQRIGLGTCDSANGTDPNRCRVDATQTEGFKTDLLYSLADVNAIQQPENTFIFGKSSRTKIDQLTRIFAAHLKGRIIQVK